MVKWLKEAELNNEKVKSRMSCNSRSSKSSSKSGNSRSSKVSIEERAIKKNRLAGVIAEANYADQKMKMEYDKKKLQIEERAAKAKVLNIFGDLYLSSFSRGSSGSLFHGGI